MAEVAAVKQLAGPHETLLVADALTGQDAVNVATSTAVTRASTPSHRGLFPAWAKASEAAQLATSAMAVPAKTAPPSAGTMWACDCGITRRTVWAFGFRLVAAWAVPRS